MLIYSNLHFLSCLLNFHQPAPEDHHQNYMLCHELITFSHDVNELGGEYLVHHFLYDNILEIYMAEVPVKRTPGKTNA